MGKLLVVVVRFITEKIRWLLLIMLVLLAGSWLRAEWQLLVRAEFEQQQLQHNLQQLQQQARQLGQLQQQLSAATVELTRQAADKARAYQDLQHRLQQLRQQRQRYWDEHWLARNNPLSDVAGQLRVYDAQITILASQQEIARRLSVDWQNRLNASPEVVRSRQLMQQLQQSEADLRQTRQQLTARDDELAQSWLRRVRALAWSVLPTALTILLGLMLTPVLFKVLMYFALAPWVSRLPPIRLLPEEPQQPVARAQGRVSSNQLTVVLEPAQELLIHPDYLQSYSQHARKTTRWFLNARLPFTSLASGLVTLVRVRSDQAEVLQLASSRHVHAELLVLDLPAGATLVCKPHGLVGVIKQRDDEVRITRHWRIFSVHSWLTWQFRYLVFHGACQLIIKGNRGVMVEPVGQPRLIQQAATLGFSAGAAYSNYRCETFVSYYLGKDSLFNDRFSGDAGIYFYEQIPDSREQQDWVSRIFGGFWDALLKVFGI